MALDIECSNPRCQRPIDDPGALVFGPPHIVEHHNASTGEVTKEWLVRKDHLCVDCYEQMRAAFL